MKFAPVIALVLLVLDLPQSAEKVILIGVVSNLLC